MPQSVKLVTRISILFAMLATSLAVRAGQPIAETNLALHRAAYQSSALNYDDVAHLATDGSAATHWASKPDWPQWIYVDLGQPGVITRVKLHWDAAFATVYSIQVAANGSPEAAAPKNWTDVYHTDTGHGNVEDIALKPVQARYVRLYVTQSATPEGGCSVNEFEIYGKRPAAASQLRPAPTLLPDGTLPLTGGNWKLQSASFVTAEGAEDFPARF